MHTRNLVAAFLLFSLPTLALDTRTACRELEQRFESLDKKLVCEGKNAAPHLLAERNLLSQLHDSLNCRSSAVVEMALQHREPNACR